MFDKAPKGLEKLQWTPEKAKASRKRAMRNHKRLVAYQYKKMRGNNY